MKCPLSQAKLASLLRLQIHLVLVDDSGNQMRMPSVRTGTTGPDTEAPNAYVRPPCSVPSELDCPSGPGLKYCGNIGANYVDMFLRTDEAGATYFVLTKLLAGGSSGGAAASSAAWSACESLSIRPGMMLQTPEGEQWRGCQAPDRRRALRATAGLRGEPTVAPQSGSDRMVSAEPKSSPNDGMWGDLVSAERSLAQLSVTPQPGCMAEQPCECCQQNVNCRVPFSELWRDRAQLGDAGDIMMSACAYMWASPCTSIPIMRGIAGAAAAPSPPAAAPLLAAPEMTTSPRSLLSTTQLRPFTAAAGVVDESLEAQLSDGLPHSRTLLQAFARSEMELAEDSSGGNTSSSAYHQPTFVNTTLQGVLEPDTFYALFAVTEDKARPQPNLLPAAKQWIFRTQTTAPPACSIACPSEGASLDSVQLDVELNTSGTVYYVVQRSGVPGSPTAAQVRSVTLPQLRP